MVSTNSLALEQQELGRRKMGESLKQSTLLSQEITQSQNLISSCS